MHHDKYPQKRHRTTATLIALAATATLGVGACAESGNGVHVEATTQGSPLKVELQDGRQITLAAGTAVTALCRDGSNPTTLQVIINNGEYADIRANHVPRSALDNTTDPFGADAPSIQADPFGPIDQCSASIFDL